MDFNARYKIPLPVPFLLGVTRNSVSTNVRFIPEFGCALDGQRWTDSVGLQIPLLGTMKSDYQETEIVNAGRKLRISVIYRSMKNNCEQEFKINLQRRFLFFFENMHF